VVGGVVGRGCARLESLTLAGLDSESFALAEDGDPGESGLEALEHEEFP
jgi:hypothetical protein